MKKGLISVLSSVISILVGLLFGLILLIAVKPAQAFPKFGEMLTLGVIKAPDQLLPKLAKVFAKPVMANVSGFSVDEYTQVTRRLAESEAADMIGYRESITGQVLWYFFRISSRVLAKPKLPAINSDWSFGRFTPARLNTKSACLQAVSSSSGVESMSYS